MASLFQSSSFSVLTQRFSPVTTSFNFPDRRSHYSHKFKHTRCSVSTIKLASQETTISGQPLDALDIIMRNYIGPDLPIQRFFLIADIDPSTAKVAIGILGPFLSAFAFLFVLRIVMSWYPKLPVGKFPYVIAYAPTEPILNPTRKLIPPVGGVDVSPVVWFGLVSFLNEILLGPQGLLVLVSQQVN